MFGTICAFLDDGFCYLINFRNLLKIILYASIVQIFSCYYYIYS